MGDEAAETADAYAAWLSSWASPRTVDARRTLALALLRDWGVGGLTSERLAEFMARPRSDGKPKSRWTRSTYFNHLTNFCEWLLATGRLEENLMEPLRHPPRPSGKPRPLSEAEVAKVLSVVEGQPRDWILLALLAGLRVSEIAKLKGEDVNADGIYVLGKGGNEVVLPCHRDLWDMAQHYPRRGYWFPGTEDGHIRGQQVSLIIGRFFTALGIEGSIHRCRHVYGTRLLRQGTNIRTVQKLMRHANLDTTANYTAVDEDELRAAIDLLPPVA